MFIDIELSQLGGIYLTKVLILFYICIYNCKFTYLGQAPHIYIYIDFIQNVFSVQHFGSSAG